LSWAVKGAANIAKSNIKIFMVLSRIKLVSIQNYLLFSLQYFSIKSHFPDGNVDTRQQHASAGRQGCESLPAFFTKLTINPPQASVNPAFSEKVEQWSR
jgi:hypothetical protein